MPQPMPLPTYPPSAPPSSGGYPPQTGYPPSTYPPSGGYNSGPPRGAYPPSTYPPAAQPSYQPGYPPASNPGYPPASHSGYPPSTGGYNPTSSTYPPGPGGHGYEGPRGPYAGVSYTGVSTGSSTSHLIPKVFLTLSLFVHCAVRFHIEYLALVFVLCGVRKSSTKIKVKNSKLGNFGVKQFTKF